jgi:hypothetical protein
MYFLVYTVCVYPYSLYIQDDSLIFTHFSYLYKTSEVFGFYMVRQNIDYSARRYSFLSIYLVPSRKKNGRLLELAQQNFCKGLFHLNLIRFSRKQF